MSSSMSSRDAGFKNLVRLALFDDRLQDTVKLKMVANLQKPSRKQLKPLDGKSENLDDPFKDFMISRSMLLAREPKELDDDVACQVASQRPRALKVINDATEWGISPIQCYNTSAKSEEQRQYLLQLMHHHW